MGVYAHSLEDVTLKLGFLVFLGSSTVRKIKLSHSLLWHRVRRWRWWEQRSLPWFEWFGHSWIHTWLSDYSSRIRQKQVSKFFAMKQNRTWWHPTQADSPHCATSDKSCSWIRSRSKAKEECQSINPWTSAASFHKQSKQSGPPQSQELGKRERASP